MGVRIAMDMEDHGIKNVNMHSAGLEEVSDRMA